MTNASGAAAGRPVPTFVDFIASMLDAPGRGFRAAEFSDSGAAAGEITTRSTKTLDEVSGYCNRVSDVCHVGPSSRRVCTEPPNASALGCPAVLSMPLLWVGRSRWQCGGEVSEVVAAHRGGSLQRSDGRA